MGLTITPSRRTPAAVRGMLAAAFAGDARAFLWDREGANPYRGILALADRLVVTSDSVSMVSEALAARAPVEVLDLGFRRHVGFIADLAASGAIRRFEGDPSPPPSRPPINETARVAEIVNQLLSERASSERPAVPAPASRR
jgi:mitochondrial fission protein ELM1